MIKVQARKFFTLGSLVSCAPANHPRAEGFFCEEVNKMTAKIPLFQCQECGRKFYTTASAEKASYGDNGCPGCGGSDIDIYVAAEYTSIRR